MNATEMEMVVKELIKVLRNMSDEDCDSTIPEIAELDLDRIKEELGSWFIEDFGIYRAS